MISCTPFLLFDGNCAEAMTFYHQCFGGELILTKVGDTPMSKQFPVEKHHRIIYAHLKNNSIEFSATDWMASPMLEPMQGNTFSIYMTGESFSELKTVFDKLSENADRDKRTFMELHEQPFGIYGQLTDQYKVSWIFKGDK
jgi:PhnB protein